MKTKPSYLVIDTYRPRPTIVRVTQAWPTLGPHEVAVRLALEIPDSLHPVHEVLVEAPEAVLEAITVEANPPEEED
jgi:hypothetical protein